MDKSENESSSKEDPLLMDDLHIFDQYYRENEAGVTSLVRNTYLNELKKQLYQNFQSFCHTKNLAANKIKEKSISSIARQIEMEALYDCMSGTIYKQIMLDKIKNIKVKPHHAIPPPLVVNSAVEKTVKTKSVNYDEPNNYRYKETETKQNEIMASESFIFLKSNTRKLPPINPKCRKRLNFTDTEFKPKIMKKLNTSNWVENYSIIAANIENATKATENSIEFKRAFRSINEISPQAKLSDNKLLKDNDKLSEHSILKDEIAEKKCIEDKKVVLQNNCNEILQLINMNKAEKAPVVQKSLEKKQKLPKEMNTLLPIKTKNSNLPKPINNVIVESKNVPVPVRDINPNVKPPNSTSAVDSPVLTQNNDNVLKEMTKMFQGQENKLEDVIFGDDNTVSMPGPSQIQSPGSNSSEQVIEVSATLGLIFNPENKNFWINEECVEFYALNQKLRIMEDLCIDKYNKVKQEFARFFGENDSSEEEEPLPLDQLKNHIKSRIGNYVCKALNPFFRNEQIKSRVLFKSFSKSTVLAIVPVNPFISGTQVFHAIHQLFAVEKYFVNHPAKIRPGVEKILEYISKHKF